MSDPVEPPTSLTPDLDSNPDLLPKHEQAEPLPPKPHVDNSESKMALEFLKAGMPLQDGPPGDPNLALTQLRKTQRSQQR